MGKTVYDSEPPKEPDDSGLILYHVFTVHSCLAKDYRDAVSLAWTFLRRERKPDQRFCVTFDVFDEEQLIPDVFVAVVKPDGAIEHLSDGDDEPFPPIIQRGV